MTVSLSSSLTPRPSASVISALTVDALISTGGVYRCGEEVTKSRNMSMSEYIVLIRQCEKVKTCKYLALRFLGIILSFLHSCGHLIHGSDDRGAGLTQTLSAMSAVHLCGGGEKKEQL